MNIQNVQKELISFLEMQREAGGDNRILLHSCCAPCSSTCLEVLTRYVPVTVLYYNPNITDRAEYEYRLAEQKRLLSEMPMDHKADLIEGPYDPERFLAMAKGLEDAPERGPRCHKCYRLRLEETAATAKREGIPYFATTLTLSPLKPADIINDIGCGLSAGGASTPDGKAAEATAGEEAREAAGGAAGGAAGETAGGTAGETAGGAGSIYLPTDFKKFGGYQRSIELSRIYGLYRQNYCGCIYSRRD